MQPYLLIASIEYCEHEGENLQLVGKSGDRRYLYSLKTDSNAFFMHEP